ncbi:MAG TPA: MFS transporter [Bacteroidota bacterium]|nr:MFS transporter [Bacteroidota bacterium]
MRFLRYLMTFPAFRSLHHRNYRLFFFGQLLSLIGTWMQNIAQAWLVYELTHSAVWLGTVGFLNSIPVLLFSMFGGTLADKMKKKPLIIATQTASMVQAFVLAGLYWSGLITPVVVGILAFTLGLVNAFDMPTRQSFVVEMVGKKDLSNAIALNSAIFNGARMFGPAIGGIIIGLFGVGWCFFLNGVSFIAVIVGLLMMDVVEKPRGGQDTTVLRAIKDGVAYVRSEKVLEALMMLIGVVTVFGWSYAVLLPIFADRILGIGAMGLGNLLSANGIGALIGALTVASVAQSVPPRKFIYGGLAVFSASLLIFSVSTSALLSMLCLVGVGMGLISFFATANSTLQTTAPDALRGRVMGLYALVFQGFFPFGSLAIGYLADAVGVRSAVAVGGSVCAVAGGAMYKVMNKRRTMVQSSMTQA